ncbi:MAG: hypothetical protein KME54_15395 [Tolypothrix brevis GSE-NOS-MK-07-07A]|nr:hypothetical protein [Tolypothrix brevis GSE-NOS-MK-07-07A]
MDSRVETIGKIQGRGKRGRERVFVFDAGLMGGIKLANKSLHMRSQNSEIDHWNRLITGIIFCDSRNSNCSR